MSPSDLNRLIYTKTRQTLSRWVTIALLGAAVGLVVGQVLHSVSAPPVYSRNSTALIAFGDNMIGVDVVRTRTTWCDLHPSRVLITFRSENGIVLPFILPVPTQNALWPKLGRQHFVVLSQVAPGLPDGAWFVQSTFRDNCHWYSPILGSTLIATRLVGFWMQGGQINLDNPPTPPPGF